MNKECKEQLNEMMSFMDRMDKHYTQSELEVINESKNIRTIDDFFNFLENDPRNMTFAYVYYFAPVAMNKTYVVDGVKQENPMNGKVFKLTAYRFNYGKTYAETVAKKNPEWEIQQRKGDYQKIEGYSVLETGKNGKLFLPICDFETTSSAYFINEEGKLIPTQKEDIAMYIKPYSPTTSGSGVNFRPLSVDRIVRLAGGGALWVNPTHEFGDLVSQLQ